MKLTRSYYRNSNVVWLAQDLLGKTLITELDGQRTAGKIVETEAYCGATDKACHAHFKRRTKRTEIMFGDGGYAYVYLCYGIHHLFNIVTNTEGNADAVLVRAVEPLEGIELMGERREVPTDQYRLTAGPGSMSKALGINKSHYGLDLTGNTIWIEDVGIQYPTSELKIGPRVGIDYAEEDALLPWRFRVKGNRWCSK